MNDISGNEVVDVSQAMCDSEINFGISSFWDGGITAKLGDPMNGFKAEGTFDTLKEALDWLAQQALEAYPDSVFAKRSRGEKAE